MIVIPVVKKRVINKLILMKKIIITVCTCPNGGNVGKGCLTKLDIGFNGGNAPRDPGRPPIGPRGVPPIGPRECPPIGPRGGPPIGPRGGGLLFSCNGGGSYNKKINKINK